MSIVRTDTCTCTVTPRLCLQVPLPAPDAFRRGTPGRPRLTTTARTSPRFPVQGGTAWENRSTSSYFSSNVLGPPQPLRPTSEVSSAPGLSPATFPTPQPGALPTSHLCSAVPKGPAGQESESGEPAFFSGHPQLGVRLVIGVPHGGGFGGIEQNIGIHGTYVTIAKEQIVSLPVPCRVKSIVRGLRL